MKPVTGSSISALDGLRPVLGATEDMVYRGEHIMLSGVVQDVLRFDITILAVSTPAEGREHCVASSR
jgi:hypothetical protein